MKLRDLIPGFDQLKGVQGVEAHLRRRRQIGNQGGIVVMMLGALLQLWIFLFGEISGDQVLGYLSALAEFTHKKIIGEPTGMYVPAYEMIAAMSGIFIILAGFGFIFLVRHTRLLVKESEEPFRYTFWIDKFTPVEGLDSANDPVRQDQPANNDHPEPEFVRTWHFHLLHHDLKERLNMRIKRLSLLNSDALKDEKPGIGGQNSMAESALRLPAHIHIDGHFTIREKRDNERIIHVMPRVRIGDSGQPSTLAFPVKFKLEKNQRKLTADRYNQLVERVYSSIATEIYKQIESDVKQKMTLFPTKYLRAVAYFNEAEDFARSNTIDAYDHAIELYREARRYFEIARFKKLTEYMIRLPLLWRFRVNGEHHKAKIQIGYAKCLIYRRVISILSGRFINPIFEIIPELKEVIHHMELLHKKMSPSGKDGWSYYFIAFLRYPKDSRYRYLFRKPPESLFERQRCILFDAHIVSALAFFYLEAVEKPREHLDKAKGIDPPQSEKNALYLLAKGITEPDVDKKIPHLRQATERAPEFQFAQYMLAYWFEMYFRRSNEIISNARIKRVIKKYERVLEINPGNIAALAAEGHLYWLLGDLDKARKKFMEGSELKAIASETFLGELYYGLARIAAEEGRFNDSYDLYHQAIQVDPGVAAWSVLASTRSSATPFFEFIGPSMLKRYEEFRDTVSTHRDRKKSVNKAEYDTSEIRSPDSLMESHQEGETRDEDVSEKVIKAVYSFVLNDYGNACFNYHFRLGDSEYLNRAGRAYEQAILEYPENIVAKYNIYLPYRWKADKESEYKSKKYLEDIVNKFPIWQAAVISLAKHSAEKYNKELEAYRFGLSAIQKKKPNRSPEQEPEGPSGMDSAKADLEAAKNQARNQMDTAKYNLLKNTMWSSLTSDYKKDPEADESGMKLDKDVKGADVNLFQLLKDRKVRWERLGDYDAYALSVWAEVLSYDDNANPNDLIQLCKHLYNDYYPENFDVSLTCEKVLDRLSKQNGQDKWLKEKRACLKMIKANIKYWLDHDPVHFYSLDWATKYYRDDEIDELIKQYCKAIRINRNQGLEHINHVYYNLLGVLYDRQGKYLYSISNYKKAIYLSEESPIYHCNLGRAFGELNDWSQMIRHCGNAVEWRKKHPGDAFGLDYYYDYLSEAYFRAEKPEEFEKRLTGEDKLRKIERARFYNSLGNYYFEKGDYEKAIPFYKKAIDENGGSPIYHSNLGQAFGLLNDWTRMIGHCGNAVELRKKQPGDAYGLEYYYNLLAEAYFRADKLEEFEQILQTEVNLSGIELARVYNRIGNLCFEKFEYVDAIPYYKKAVEKDDQTPIYHCNLGRAYGNLANPDLPRMIEHCGKAVELNKKQPEDEFSLDYYYGFLAEAYFQAGNMKVFERRLLAENKLNDIERALVYYRIGDLYSENFDFESADRYYDKASQLNHLKKAEVEQPHLTNIEQVA